eukprot:3718995-Amphidinium_carterae.2
MKLAKQKGKQGGLAGGSGVSQVQYHMSRSQGMGSSDEEHDGASDGLTKDAKSLSLHPHPQIRRDPSDPIRGWEGNKTSRQQQVNNS